MQVQELEVWYVIPAIRREICRVLHDGGISQKQIAKRLAITEAAVSQYINDKRAMRVSFSREFEKELENYAEKVGRGEMDSYAAIQFLTRKLLDRKELCEIHYKMDKDVPRGCDVCFAPCG